MITFLEEHTLRDRFQVDEQFTRGLDFPCCVCQHRHGTDRDEPCSRCTNNVNATTEAA